jgi:ATP-binding cassette, subfamily C (CFTR/MRP), member 4
LARALYGEASIYIFDDPLSAVDAKVAKSLFHECFQPLSRTKLVILVTHQIHYIQECDEAIIMEDGEFSVIGKPSSIKADLNELMKTFKVNEDE